MMEGITIHITHCSHYASYPFELRDKTTRLSQPALSFIFRIEVTCIGIPPYARDLYHVISLHTRMIMCRHECIGKST